MLLSPEQIKNSGIFVSFLQESNGDSKEEISVNMTLSGLTANLTYEIWCVGEDSNGNMNSIDVLNKTKIFATTLCCRTISFINAPLFIYENLDSYVGVSNTDLYVYKYSIQISPGKSLSISPLVLVENTSNITNLVVVTPTSITFSNTKSYLQTFFGSFILSGIPGSYNVNLTFLNINEDTKIYNPVNAISVSILPDSSDPPFPNIKSARYTSSGSTISVLFDSPTDQAAHYSSTLETKIPPLFRCDIIFLFKSSSSSTCSWNNDSSLVISSDSSSNVEYLKIGDSISFRSNVIKAACKKSHNSIKCSNYLYAPNSTSVSVLGPSTPLLPSVIIKSPEKLASCDNFTLDASSSSGKKHSSNINP